MSHRFKKCPLIFMAIETFVPMSQQPWQNTGHCPSSEKRSLVGLTVPRRYFCGSFMLFSVLCLLCHCARLFICDLWSPAWKGWPLGSRLWCLNWIVTFQLISSVRCGTWLYRFQIFAPLLTLKLWYPYFVWFDPLHPINHLSVKQGRVFLGWTSSKLW